MLPRLVINSTHAQLSIESEAAQIMPRQRRMKMVMESEAPTFQANVGLPQVQIDQTESFASAGNKPVLRVSGDFYRESLQKGIDSIAKIASESTAFLKIENDRNTAVDLAKQSMAVDIRLTVRSMPSTPPKIDFTGSDFQLDWSPATFNMKWESEEISAGEYVPGKVNITLATHPSIEIYLEPGVEINLPVNTGVGTSVDAST